MSHILYELFKYQEDSFVRPIYKIFINEKRNFCLWCASVAHGDPRTYKCNICFPYKADYLNSGSVQL